MITVRLTPKEVEYGQEIGLRRNREQRKTGRRDGKVVKNSKKIDIDGARSEYAISKALDLPWDGKFFNTKEWLVWRKIGHDVSFLESRSTDHPTGRLIIHPKDPGHSPFVLVRNRCPEFDLVGWAWGAHGKETQWWLDVGHEKPAFYVPDHLLEEMKDLVFLINVVRNENKQVVDKLMVAMRKQSKIKAYIKQRNVEV